MGLRSCGQQRHTNSLFLLKADDCWLFVQVFHGEEPDPLHPLGGRVHQQLLFQSQARTDGHTRPELSPSPPDHPGPEPAGRGSLLHRFIPICGCRLYLRPGHNQPQLNHLNLNLSLDLNHLNQWLGMETKESELKSGIQYLIINIYWFYSVESIICLVVVLDWVILSGDTNLQNVKSEFICTHKKSLLSKTV